MTLHFPTPDAHDRIPHHRAVWREGDGLAPMGEPHSRLVSVDYGGWIEQTTVGAAKWGAVKRWRFGHAPTETQ